MHSYISMGAFLCFREGNHLKIITDISGGRMTVRLMGELDHHGARQTMLEIIDRIDQLVNSSIDLFSAHIPELSGQDAASADLFESAPDLRLEEYYDADETYSDESGQQPVEKTEAEKFRSQKNADNQKDAPEQLLSSRLLDHSQQPVQDICNDNDVNNICYLDA